MAHILAIDDEAQLCVLLRTALERDGHEVQTLTSGEQLTQAQMRWADCVILDVMMPGEDGFALCRRIRELVDCPILFLTAKTEEADILTGLGAGGDDYLTKPFRIAELRARVQAHLRREKRTPHTRFARGQVVFDLEARRVLCGGQPVRLTRSEYALCEHLAMRPGQVFTREQLYEAVFGFDGTSDSAAIAEHIKNIRAKLREAGATPIETVWGMGYKWKEDEA